MLFAPGNKFGKGRPPGARNKPVNGPIINSERKIWSTTSPTILRFGDLLARVINDLGGEAELSEAQVQLARRASWICAQCEVLETRAEPGAPNDLVLYAMLTGRLVQVLTVLGLKREPRDITPTLQDYLNAVRQPSADETPQ
jgi:hypothetical protein